MTVVVRLPLCMPPDFSHTYPSTQDIYWSARLRHFATQLPAYVDRYKVTPAELTRVERTASWYTAWLVYRLQQATEMLQQGAGEAVPTDSLILDLAPAKFALLRVRALARQLQRHPDYTLADGYVLGLPPVPHIVHQRGLPHPQLRIVETDPAGAPTLRWRNRRDTILELEVCRDGHTWHSLTPLLLNCYADPHPHPAQLARWQYRARYYWAEWSTGQWGRVVHQEVGRGCEGRT